VFEASLFLTPLLWQSIGEVVLAARGAMDWLQEVAAKVSDARLPINWQTPDGFWVQQAYVESKEQRVDTVLDGGSRLRVRYAVDSDVMCKRRQRNGIAPNWVHSMDATALRVFVNMAHDNGVRSFSLVHDSYGSLAADCPLVAVVLREAFVMIYKDRRPLDQFLRDVSKGLDDDVKVSLPSPPPVGALDIDLVLGSHYFFA
jgi:DNA-directed RNA polymerase